VAMTTLDDLLVHGLRDMYHAEKQLTKALPRMARAASNTDLRSAFETHLEETNQQLEMLEQVFESLDTGLVVAARKVEHYEIASYSGLIELARQLGHGEAARLLASILEQESAADAKLSKLAASSLKRKAA
jgi:ferritin-like metal-binding protein YciE